MEQLGKWISNQTKKPFYARKVIEMKKRVQRATAYVCGLGQFHFYLNGRKVEDHQLDPGWTNYHKLVQYVTFDVTNQLQPGKNAIGVEVGNGWYHMDRERYFMSMPPKSPDFSFLPPNPNPYQPFGPCLVLTFRLEVEYQDGEKEQIISDESWKLKEHFVTLANVYGSEILDGRLRQDDFASVSYDDSAWEYAKELQEQDCPKGRLVSQTQPPVVVKHTYDAIYLNRVKNRDIYDFTQNMSGILEFEVRGKRGDMVNLFPAEKLGEDGDVDQIAKGWTPVDVCITYIIGADDVWEKCRMKFTYFAGRYLAVEGAVREASEKEAQQMPQIHNIRADYITSACKDTGSFTCDDQRLEQIYDLVYRAVESNLNSVHTDCPSIERYAWQEPNHLLAPSIMFMKDVRTLWEKILMDLRVDQCTEETWFYGLGDEKIYPGAGLLPSQAPCYEYNVLPAPMGSFFDIIPWGSTGILAPYWHYLYYGDKKILEDNYDMGIRYLEYLKTKVTEEGFINHGLGDWGNPDSDSLARENIETAFLYADAVTLAKTAIVLGKYQDMIELEDYAKQVKDRYNQNLLVQHPTEGFWCYRAWDHPDEIFLTQACQAIPLYFGLVPDEKRKDVEKAFAWVLDRDQTFCSGEVGLPYIIQTMASCGMHDRIIDFMLRPVHPSYYAFVLAGETTLGEYWEENPRSHNHDMMGHIVEWYFNGIGGIKPIKPGFEQIEICPYLPKTAKEFTCCYESVRGLIRVHVRQEDDKILVETTVPEGVVYHTDDRYLRQRGMQVEWKII